MHPAGANRGKRKGLGMTLHNFFPKVSKEKEKELPSPPPPQRSPSPAPHLPEPHSPVGLASSSQNENPLIWNRDPCADDNVCDAADSADVGKYIGNLASVDDFTKCMLLERPWIPPSSYTFPHNVVTKKNKPYKKYAQRSHFEKFHWLVLSDKDKGLYCKYCVLFASGEGGGHQTNAKLQKLVKKPLREFDDLLGETGKLRKHERHEYHKDAVVAGKDFLRTYYNPGAEVVNQVTTQRHLQVQENRARLRPIVESLVWCGRQNVSVRGHDDGGIVGEEPEASSINKGNFKELLKFRADSGDTTLQEHLKTSSARATYISAPTQNELIDCCREEIQQSILNRVKESGMYSIIFDETTDVAHLEQLSLSFRYIYEDTIREDFIGFLDCYEKIPSKKTESHAYANADANKASEDNAEDSADDSGDDNASAEESAVDNADGDDGTGTTERRLTGVALGQIVLNMLADFSVDILKCVGVATDNCSVMASEARGAAQEIMKKAVNARRCPCANHMLNNSLAKTSKVIPCRNATGVMKKVIQFPNASAKRTAVFRSKLGKRFAGLCETRWAEKHDGHLQFKDNLPQICTSLETISKWKDAKTASEAYGLLQSLRSPEFIVSMMCLCDVLVVTKPLSTTLQSESLDYNKGVEAVNNTIAVLEKRRKTSEQHFGNVYKAASDVADSVGINLAAEQRRRVVGRQIYRQNQPASTNEEYYRRAVYAPLLDHVISDLKDRFPSDMLAAYNLRCLLPKYCGSNTGNDSVDANIRELYDRYKGILEVSEQEVLAEYELWVLKCKSLLEKEKEAQKEQNSVINVLKECDADMYPSIRRLLQVLGTLPLSVATAERSFSTLRRLKTWLRSTMGEDRLTGLALLSIHRDITVSIDNVIERFSKKKNRRLEFVL